MARETNEELRSFKAAPGEGFDVGAILAVAKRCGSLYFEESVFKVLEYSQLLSVVNFLCIAGTFSYVIMKLLIAYVF